jgi:hypothetical protein
MVKKILIQLDGDKHPSVFDSVVAIDSEVDHLLQYVGVAPDDVRDLAHGAIFTRKPDELKNTAIFIGGANVAHGESLLAAATKCFFGPMRVSVMLDANGANTTAAAAVLAAARHLSLKDCQALVLAATGPVGQRVVRLLAKEGAKVRAASRNLARANEACDAVAARVPGAKLTPLAVSSSTELSKALEGIELVIAAGAASVELLPLESRKKASSLKVAIDLNAVAPVGIGGIKQNDKATKQDGVVCYGAIGVGNTKMKIHKAAIRRLFQANDLVLDADEIFAIGRELETQA